MKEQTAVVTDQTKQRITHLEQLKAAQDPYQVTRFERTRSIAAAREKYEHLKSEEHAVEKIKVGGRLMALRDLGKAAFADLVDLSGKIQLYFKVDLLGEEKWKTLQALDLGDLVGVEGAVFRTRRGELSLEVHELLALAKCLHPLPEKWHGLKEVEVRYRKRYLDLIVNPDVRKIFLLRSKLISGIRRFLDSRGYHEMETPVMSKRAGGADARPFETHHNVLDLDLYLRIATELYLKRLIVGGLEKVYEIGRIFRNEGVSTKHNPEFTMLELYEAYTDYHGMMRITEELLVNLADELAGTRQIPYQGQTISLAPPFARITYREALRQYGNIDLDEIRNLEKAKETARRLKISVDRKAHVGHLLDKIFEVVAEPHFVQPTFVLDYPIELSPLAKKKKEDPSLTYRFELFIMRMEMANAFSELNDPIDQRKRFTDQSKLREAGDEEAQMFDEDFVQALEFGMPPTGGLGIGIDRLCMLYADVASIREVILFPLLKPKKEETEDK